MAKGSGDVILRDRLQFTLDATGSLSTVYGRMDLSQYTGGNKGLAIKEVRYQLRDPGTGNGVFSIVGDNTNTSGATATRCSYKLFATTRAYENAADVGIASPDVLCVEEGQWVLGTVDAGLSPEPSWAQWDRHWFGPEDLHPAGFTVVTDLLVGIAFDNWDIQENQTLELDVLLVADPVTVTETRMRALLAQAQDL